MKKIEIGLGQEKWNLNVSDRLELFPRWAARQGIELLARWERVFPMEETWVRRTHGTPSLLVRLDCVVEADQLRIYEVEERPAGVGISTIVNSQFADLFAEVRQSWPAVTVVMCPTRRGGDDYLWANQVVVGVENAPAEGIVLARCEPHQDEFHHLEPRSVSTLREEGNKGYGVDLGLWSVVSSPDQLPWAEGFALKPVYGSKSKDIVVWTGAKRDRGASTRSQVERVLVKNGSMYCQPLIRPMVGPEGQYIFRVYFARGKDGWRCIGGLWMARNNLVVHGAGDSVTGPAVIE